MLPLAAGQPLAGPAQSKHPLKPLSLSKDPLAADKEMEGAQEDATSRTALGEDAGSPALPEPQDNRQDGFASMVWEAVPGMLFQEDRQTSLHPLVSTNGLSATGMVQRAPCSLPSPETSVAVMPLLLRARSCLFPTEPVLGAGLQQQPGRAQPDGRGGPGAPVRLLSHGGYPRCPGEQAVPPAGLDTAFTSPFSSSSSSSQTLSSWAGRMRVEDPWEGRQRDLMSRAV